MENPQPERLQAQNPYTYTYTPTITDASLSRSHLTLPISLFNPILLPHFLILLPIPPRLLHVLPRLVHPRRPGALVDLPLHIVAPADGFVHESLCVAFFEEVHDF